MNIKVRNIPKEGRKGTTKLENLPEFCITMYGADKEAREGLMKILDGLGVRWASKRRIFEEDSAQWILDGTHWLFFDPKGWHVTRSEVAWCEEHTEYLHLSLDHFKNLVEDYLYEHQ